MVGVRRLGEVRVPEGYFLEEIFEYMLCVRLRLYECLKSKGIVGKSKGWRLKYLRRDVG